MECRRRSLAHPLGFSNTSMLPREAGTMRIAVNIYIVPVAVR